MKRDNFFLVYGLILFVIFTFLNPFCQQEKDLSICYFSNSVTIDNNGMTFFIPTDFFLYKDSLVMKNPKKSGRERTFYFKNSLDSLPITQQVDLDIFELNKEVYYYISNSKENPYIVADMNLKMDKEKGTLKIKTIDKTLLYQIVKSECGK